MNWTDQKHAELGIVGLLQSALTASMRVARGHERVASSAVHCGQMWVVSPHAVRQDLACTGAVNQADCGRDLPDSNQ